MAASPPAVRVRLLLLIARVLVVLGRALLLVVLLQLGLLLVVALILPLLKFLDHGRLCDTRSSFTRQAGHSCKAEGAALPLAGHSPNSTHPTPLTQFHSRASPSHFPNTPGLWSLRSIHHQGLEGANTWSATFPVHHASTPAGNPSTHHMPPHVHAMQPTPHKHQQATPHMHHASTPAGNFTHAPAGNPHRPSYVQYLKCVMFL